MGPSDLVGGGTALLDQPLRGMAALAFRLAHAHRLSPRVLSRVARPLRRPRTARFVRGTEPRKRSMRDETKHYRRDQQHDRDKTGVDDAVLASRAAGGFRLR